MSPGGRGALRAGRRPGPVPARHPGGALGHPRRLGGARLPDAVDDPTTALWWAFALIALNLYRTFRPIESKSSLRLARDIAIETAITTAAVIATGGVVVGVHLLPRHRAHHRRPRPRPVGPRRGRDPVSPRSIATVVQGDELDIDSSQWMVELVAGRPHRRLRPAHPRARTSEERTRNLEPHRPARRRQRPAVQPPPRRPVPARVPRHRRGARRHHGPPARACSTSTAPPCCCSTTPTAAGSSPAATASASRPASPPRSSRRPSSAAVAAAHARATRTTCWPSRRARARPVAHVRPLRRPVGPRRGHRARRRSSTPTVDHFSEPRRRAARGLRRAGRPRHRQRPVVRPPAHRRRRGGAQPHRPRPPRPHRPVPRLPGLRARPHRQDRRARATTSATPLAPAPRGRARRSSPRCATPSTTSAPTSARPRASSPPLELFVGRRARAQHLRDRCGPQRPRARLPIPQERELFRIAQEALVNVERHADAEHVTVAWRCDGRSAELVVTDDGDGFPVGRSGRLDSYGLVGMRERAAAIGARLDVESTPGQGTRIRCRGRPP